MQQWPLRPNVKFLLCLIKQASCHILDLGTTWSGTMTNRMLYNLATQTSLSYRLIHLERMHESTVHTNTKNTLFPPTASLGRGEKFRSSDLFAGHSQLIWTTSVVRFSVYLPKVTYCITLQNWITTNNWIIVSDSSFEPESPRIKTDPPLEQLTTWDAKTNSNE
jgi:hypothetical protein